MSRTFHADAMRRHWADPDWRAHWLESRRRSTEDVRLHGGLLYAAEVIGTDAIKIGFSRWPESRVQGLRKEYKVDVRMLAFAPGTPLEERHLHKILKPFRRREFGGWEFYPRSVLLHDAVPPALRCPLSRIAYDPWVKRWGIDRSRGWSLPNVVRLPLDAVAA